MSTEKLLPEGIKLAYRVGQNVFDTLQDAEMHLRETGVKKEIKFFLIHIHDWPEISAENMANILVEDQEKFLDVLSKLKS